MKRLKTMDGENADCRTLIVKGVHQRANRPPIKNGVMDVSPGPGFGLVLDDALVRRYRTG